MPNTRTNLEKAASLLNHAAGLINQQIEFRPSAKLAALHSEVHYLCSALQAEVTDGAHDRLERIADDLEKLGEAGPAELVAEAKSLL